MARRSKREAGGGRNPAPPRPVFLAPPSLSAALRELSGLLEAPRPPPPVLPAAAARPPPLPSASANDFALRLVPYLGHGVVELMLQAQPQRLNMRDCCAYSHASSSDAAARAGAAAPVGVARIVRPGAAAAAADVTATGLLLRVADGAFVSAVMQLPIDRVASATTLAAIARRAKPSSGSDLREPDDTPLELLPRVPRPLFDDYFPQQQQPATEAASPPPPSTTALAARSWPLSWLQYHAAFSALLLEEVRAGLAEGAVQAGRRVVGRGGPDPAPDMGPGGSRSRGAPPLIIEGAALHRITAARGDGGGAWGGWGRGGGAEALLLSLREPGRPAGPAMLQPRDIVLLLLPSSAAAAAPAMLGIVMGGGGAADVTVRVVVAAAVARTLHAAVARTSGDSDVGASSAQAATSPPLLRITVARLDSLGTALHAYQSVAGAAHTPFGGLVLAPSRAIRTSPYAPMVTGGALDNTAGGATPAAAPTLPPPPFLPAALVASLCARFDDSQLRAIYAVVTGGAFRVPFVRVAEDGDVTGAAPSTLLHTGPPLAPPPGASVTTAAPPPLRAPPLLPRHVEVTLLVGPPGTGKTRTVLGMISALRAHLRVLAAVAAAPAGAGAAAVAPPAVVTGRNPARKSVPEEDGATNAAATTTAAAAAVAGAVRGVSAVPRCDADAEVVTISDTDDSDGAGGVDDDDGVAAGAALEQFSRRDAIGPAATAAAAAEAVNDVVPAAGGDVEAAAAPAAATATDAVVCCAGSGKDANDDGGVIDLVSTDDEDDGPAALPAVALAEGLGAAFPSPRPAAAGALQLTAAEHDLGGVDVDVDADADDNDDYTVIVDDGSVAGGGSGGAHVVPDEDGNDLVDDEDGGDDDDVTAHLRASQAVADEVEAAAAAAVAATDHADTATGTASPPAAPPLTAAVDPTHDGGAEMPDAAAGAEEGEDDGTDLFIPRSRHSSVAAAAPRAAAPVAKKRKRDADADAFVMGHAANVGSSAAGGDTSAAEAERAATNVERKEKKHDALYVERSVRKMQERAQAIALLRKERRLFKYAQLLLTGDELKAARALRKAKRAAGLAAHKAKKRDGKFAAAQAAAAAAAAAIVADEGGGDGGVAYKATGEGGGRISGATYKAAMRKPVLLADAAADASPPPGSKRPRGADSRASRGGGDDDDAAAPPFQARSAPIGRAPPPLVAALFPAVAAAAAATTARRAAAGYKVRMLVCAPSNAAVDEVVSRLLALPSDEDLARQLLRVSDGARGGAGAALHADAGHAAHRHIAHTSALPLSLVGVSPLRGLARGAAVAETAATDDGDDGDSGLGGGGLLDEAGAPWVPYVVRLTARNFTSGRPEVQDRVLEVLSHRRLRMLCGKAAAAAAPAAKAAAAAPAPPLPLAATQELRRLQSVRQRLLQLVGHTRTELEARRRAAPADGAALNTAAPPPPSAASRQLVDGALEFVRAAVAGAATTPGAAAAAGADRASLLLRLHYLQREAAEAEAECEYIGAAAALGPERVATLRVRAVREVLSRADVVVATLTGCVSLNAGATPEVASWGGSRRGADTAARTEQEQRQLDLGAVMPLVTFDAVIIDEAAQAIEPEALTPLRHAYTGRQLVGTGAGVVPPVPALQPACRRLILVGDPLQLPATVLSRSAKDAGLDVSLFERLAGAGVRPLLLTTQYRMTSVVAAFSAAHFYRGFVRDAPRRAPLPLPPAGSVAPCGCCGPLVLVDAPRGRETHGSGHSYGNDEEVAIVTALLSHLTSRGSRAGSGVVAAAAAAPPPPPTSIGVITPYVEQVGRIRRAVRAALGDAAAAAIFVSSVDGFQGGERDVIIISAVRSQGGGGGGGIGFVADPRRLNVAVTRAKQSLVLIGNLAWLRAASPDWRALIDYGTARGARLALDGQRAQHGGGAVACDAFALALRERRERGVGASRDGAAAAGGGGSGGGAFGGQPRGGRDGGGWHHGRGGRR